MTAQQQLACGRERYRVLVIEDEPLIRTLVAQALRDAHVCAIEAATADEAWSYLASGSQIDIVLSDVHISGSMTGIELADRIRASYPDIPVILTSGALGNIDPATLAYPLIQRPFRLQSLKDAILWIVKH